MTSMRQEWEHVFQSSGRLRRLLTTTGLPSSLMSGHLEFSWLKLLRLAVFLIQVMIACLHFLKLVIIFCRITFSLMANFYAPIKLSATYFIFIPFGAFFLFLFEHSVFICKMLFCFCYMLSCLLSQLIYWELFYVTHNFVWLGMTNAEVLHQVEHGYRMPSPPGCPRALYEIMLECWAKDEMERPTFETLQWKLEEFFVLPASEYSESTMAVRWAVYCVALFYFVLPARDTVQHSSSRNPVNGCYGHM